MTEPEEPTSLKDLDARLRAAQARHDKAQKTRQHVVGSGMGLAFRVAVEMVAAVAVGVGIGWLLDDWLGSKPWMLILFFILGSVAGIMNVFRVTGVIEPRAGYQGGKTPGDHRDDDKERASDEDRGEEPDGSGRRT